MTVLCIFFFNQNTAYEMRISDWSSDVCSSDLPPGHKDITLGIQIQVLTINMGLIKASRHEIFSTIPRNGGHLCLGSIEECIVISDRIIVNDYLKDRKSVV